MENNAVTSEPTASLAPAYELNEITAAELKQATASNAKVTFDQPTDSPELKDFNEYLRAEEEVEEVQPHSGSIKARMADLLAGAGMTAMSNSSTNITAVWDTLTKIGMGGSAKVVKSKNWGGVLSPERRAAIVENNALVSQNAFNKDRIECKQQKKQAATILVCKPTKAQKKQLRKARTQGRLTTDITQHAIGVNAFAEQLLTDVHLSQTPIATGTDEVPQQIELLDTAGESTETVSITTIEEFTQTDTRTNIGDVLTALEVSDVDNEHTHPNYMSEESTSTAALGPNSEGEDHGSESVA